MKLKQFIAPRGGQGSSLETAPSVSFTYTNGRILFNRSTVAMLGLEVGGWLCFFQDQENTRGWYLAKVDGDAVGAVELREGRAKGSLDANSGALVRSLLDSLGIHQSCRFFISENIVDGQYLQILTDRPITWQ